MTSGINTPPTPPTPPTCCNLPMTPEAASRRWCCTFCGTTVHFGQEHLLRVRQAMHRPFRKTPYKKGSITKERSEKAFQDFLAKGGKVSYGKVVTPLPEPVDPGMQGVRERLWEVLRR